MQFQVTTSHPSPAYQTATIEVYGSSGVFYAVAPRFGCGRDAASPRAAIAELLASNGCRIVGHVVGLD